MKETLRVLIVDDEEGMRLATQRALRNFVVELPEFDSEVALATELASSGEEALEALERGPLPDILLLDHKLGGMTGLDVLERIVERKYGLLAIMVTAYASLETAVHATKLGAFDFLAKPFTPDELRTVVRKATRHFLLQRQAKKLLDEKRQIRFQFLSVLAHELKAPLAAIEGYLYIVKDHSAGDDPAVYERIVSRSLVRIEGMRKLIFDLLDLTRIESGQKKRELLPFDICEAARSAIETVTPDAAKKGVTIEFAPAGPILLTADRGEIEIIFNNLLSNAVKYNRDKGSVFLSIADGQPFITIAVRDTGIGMKPEDVSRLFGEFVRIKSEKTANILGSGLGLSILKRLARMYGGDVKVESQLDVGSTFTVTLSREAADNPPPAPDEDKLAI